MNTPRARRIANLFIEPLLQSPLHGLVSKRMMVITFNGRKTGKQYSTPVEYLRDGHLIIFFTQRHRVWWKNLLDHATVILRLQGRDVQGTAKRLTLDERLIVERLLDLYTHMTHDQAVRLAHQLVMVEIELVEERVTTVPTTTIHPAR